MLLKVAILFHFAVAETFFMNCNQLLGFLVQILVESVPDSGGGLVFIDPESYQIYGVGDNDTSNILVSHIPLFDGRFHVKVLGQ